MNIEQLREYCLSLPEVTEDIKWGNDLCFCIHEKMFCITGLNNEPMMVSLKVTPEQYDEWVGTENIISAPYVGRYKWILIQHPDRFSMKEWKKLIEQSYQLIHKKKKVSGLSKASTTQTKSKK